jgi:hypothetical protein
LASVIPAFSVEIPVNDDSPPAKIYGIMRDALLTHFREQASEAYTESPSEKVE